MVTITLVLDPPEAEQVYAAVGLVISQGDVTPAAGETQFAAAVAAICAASIAAGPTAPAPKPPMTPAALSVKR